MKALALLFLLGAFPYTYKYEMASCPSGAVSSQCASAQTCNAGTCAGTAPTTSTTAGMTLGGVSKYRITICAATGQTLSGAGSMQAYGYSTAEGVWIRNPDLDLTVTQTGRCQRWAGFFTDLAFDRVEYIASAVTVSGGAGLDVMIEGQPLVR